jgi:hypothetical protein
MYRPSCLVIGAEDNADGKTFFAYRNLVLFICYHPGPFEPHWAPDVNRPANQNFAASPTPLRRSGRPPGLDDSHEGGGGGS